MAALKAAELRYDWTVAEIEALLTLPLPELIFRAQTIHHAYHRVEEVQGCALLSIKTGGCVVVDAVASICAAGKKANTAVGMFLPDVAEFRQWQDLGASLFLLQSDQAFLLAGARDLVSVLRS